MEERTSSEESEEATATSALLRVAEVAAGGAEREEPQPERAEETESDAEASDTEAAAPAAEGRTAHRAAVQTSEGAVSADGGPLPTVNADSELVRLSRVCSAALCSICAHI